jgi:hypothetical protein
MTGLKHDDSLLNYCSFMGYSSLFRSQQNNVHSLQEIDGFKLDSSHFSQAQSPGARQTWIFANEIH